MEIEIKSNKLCNEAQTIKLDNSVLTLIGENGCGKSSILEAIFEQNLKQNDKTVVCFSSGQNESFSDSYMSFVNKARNIINIKDDGSNLLALDEIKTFYFDYDWSKFLIFFASVLKKKGLTHSFLKGKYINSTDSDGDISSSLTFPIQVQEVYINRINEALKKEETEPEIPTLRKTTFHNQLSKLIEIKINPDFDFDKPLKKTTINLCGADIIKFYKKESLSIFQFLSIAANNSFFIDIHESKLKFKNNLNLNALSDGEFQQLAIYSLIDLFDSSNTLFLLDEIDSHLHYESIERLWNILKEQLSGKVITTTHIADSIIQNEFQSLTLVQNGKIIEGKTASDVITRLNFLSNSSEYIFKVSSRLKYIALVEDQTDWIIFIELAKKKLGIKFNHEKIKLIHYIKCESDYQKEGDDFGDKKKKWVKEFSKCKLIQTKEVFLICDRDLLPINNMLPLNDPKAIKVPSSLIEVNGSPKDNLMPFVNKKYPYLLAWRRREIENYLFTATILEKNGLINIVNSKYGASGTPIKDKPMDDNSFIANLDCKSILGNLLYKQNSQGVLDLCRWDYEKLRKILEIIPASEISADIVNMYNFIVSKIN